MTKDDANYFVDKALALGVLDREGNLGFKVKGATREECIGQIEAVAASWGQPLTHAEAKAKFDDAIDKQRYRRHLWGLAIVMNAIGIWALYEAFK